MVFFNQVIISGIIHDKPTYLNNDSGTIAIIRIDVHQEWTNKDTGKIESKVETHPVLVFNNQIIDDIKKNMKPGDCVQVRGILQTRTYQSESGETRYSSRVAIGKVNGVLSYMENPGKGVRPTQEASSSMPENSEDRGARTRGNSFSDVDISF